MARANRSVLAETVVPNEVLGEISEVTFPTVDSIYQSPQFRLADAGRSSPADENWWAQQQVRANLDLFFASFLASPQSVSAPMLLLGHPGAGKSLLTKVLAARLPASAYVAIRVPLRRVDAEAPVYEQIQQALDLATNRRVNWADLADEGETTRVVLLDGLDELLQASSRGRASYLQDVAEFQRHEAEQERPVAFVVTSRTVVADQVRIPAGTTLVKLEEFTDEQIAGWLDVWWTCNQDNIVAGRMGEIALDVVMKHRALACQPLLLMMLAIYAADPAATPLDATMSNAAFYGRILDDFVRREAAKRDSGTDAADLVEDQMWRLGIAAFAMFNRDRQDISDHALGSDILALTGGLAPRIRPDRVGQETIGKFFFVYTAEADAHRVDAQRAYEFLHATFGEYLVAHHSVKVLLEVAGNSRRTHRGGREYDDDLLFALLSHESLTNRQSIIEFVTELVARFTSAERISCVQTTDALLDRYRDRADSQTYDAYQPLPVDNVRRMAAYSANLVLLRLILAPGFDPPDWWVSTVSLWRAGLGNGWGPLCRAVNLVDGKVALRTRPLSFDALEIAFHQLRGDEEAAARHQWGGATSGVGHVVETGDPYSDLVAYLVGLALDPSDEPWRVAQLAARTMARQLVEAPPSTGSERLFDLVCRYIAERNSKMGYDEVSEWIRVALHFQPVGMDQPFSAFASFIAAQPMLLVDLPELAKPHCYDVGALLVFVAAPVSVHQAGTAALRKLRDEVGARLGYLDIDSSHDMLSMVRKMLRISQIPGEGSEF